MNFRLENIRSIECKPLTYDDELTWREMILIFFLESLNCLTQQQQLYLKLKNMFFMKIPPSTGWDLLKMTDPHPTEEKEKDRFEKKI